MKVVAFNGSARLDGNTAIMINHAFKELEKEGIDTEMVQLAGKPIRGCIACGSCFKNLDKRCALPGDAVNEYVAKMEEADGIIIGSPTYFADVSTETKALIDRCGMVTRANDHMLAKKVGAAVVAVRRGGAIHAFDTINHFFLISQMVISGSDYWNMGFGREKGEVNEDQEGISTMQSLGKNMAWLLKKLDG